MDLILLNLKGELNNGEKKNLPDLQVQEHA